MSMRIIIADINSRCSNGVVTGHGIAVAENYRQLSNSETEVVVAGGPAYAKRFPDAIVLDYDTDASLSVREIKRRNLHNIKQLFELCPNDIIVFQSCAVATSFLGIALYKPKTCRVYVIQYNTDGLSSWLKRLFFSAAKRKIAGVVCPDASVGSAYGCPYCVVPDYIYSDSREKPQMPYTEKKYDFCMVGLIYPDKGTVETARALMGTSYKVLIAGKAATPEIAAELTAIAEQSPHMELRLRYLPEEEYQQCLKESRYCILNYSGAYSEHSSGVVFDVLFNGVPVVGRRCRSLAFIESFGVGELFEKIESWNPQSLLDANLHLHFCERIQEYYRTHCAFREKLLSFLKGEK